MPLTEKGHEIEANMKKQYGEKKGEQVFYASKNAGTISGVDNVPIGRGYDADPEQQGRREREIARGELRYGKALSEGRITGKEHQGFIEAVHKNASHDDVPLGSCYKDDVPPQLMSSDPPISPTSTSQYSGMKEQLHTAPQPEPHEPVDARDSLPQSSQPGHELAEAGAIERLEALHGRRSAPADFSGDANSPIGHLPAEVSFADIRRMGAGFNYNQGYGGDPYNKK
jgi:hypothetical protein